MENKTVYKGFGKSLLNVLFAHIDNFFRLFKGEASGAGGVERSGTVFKEGSGKFKHFPKKIIL